MEAKVYSDYDERFQYVFAIGLFFLLLRIYSSLKEETSGSVK